MSLSSFKFTVEVICSISSCIFVTVPKISSGIWFISSKYSIRGNISSNLTKDRFISPDTSVILSLISEAVFLNLLRIQRFLFQF